MIRACGGCSACCKTHMVLSIEKPPSAWCPDCAIGIGCKIYESRPQECSAFKCQWLLGFGTGEERPDQVRIVVDYSRNPVLGNVLVVQFWEVTEGALGRDFAQRAIKLLMGERFPIMTIDCRTRHSLFLPRGFDLSQSAFDVFTRDGVPMKYYSTL